MNIKDEKTLDDFIYMEQLELKFYSEEHVTLHQEAYLWHLSNPKTGFVLEDNGRIAAFTDVLPVKQDIFDQLVSGTFNDKYLTVDDLVFMEGLKRGESVNLLLSCVLVDEGLQGDGCIENFAQCPFGLLPGLREKRNSDRLRHHQQCDRRAGSIFLREWDLSGSESRSIRPRFTGRASASLNKRVRQLKPKLEGLLLQYEKNLLDPDFCRDIDNLNACLARGFYGIRSVGHNL